MENPKRSITFTQRQWTALSSYIAGYARNISEESHDPEDVLVMNRFLDEKSLLFVQDGDWIAPEETREVTFTVAEFQLVVRAVNFWSSPDEEVVNLIS